VDLLAKLDMGSTFCVPARSPEGAKKMKCSMAEPYSWTCSKPAPTNGSRKRNCNDAVRRVTARWRRPLIFGVSFCRRDLWELAAQLSRVVGRHAFGRHARAKALPEEGLFGRSQTPKSNHLRQPAIARAVNGRFSAWF